jgi:spermidine dehydrogenase
MDRAITRRDFLQGAALVIGAPRFQLASNGALSGQTPSAMALGHRVRDSELPPQIVDTGEVYDLLVVGAGIAGLGAAYLFHHEAPSEPSILILDNHEEFGGHARRNVMEHAGARLIAPGGTFALEDVEDSPEEAREIFRRIGLDPARLVEYRDPKFREHFGLSPAVVFDSRIFGGHTRWVNRWNEIPYETFFAGTPLGASARKDLVELYTTRKNYLPDSGDLEGELHGMSWETFVREKMRLGDDAVRFVDLYATDLIGLGCDAASALEGFAIGPGFFGMGGEGFYEEAGMLRYGYQPVNRYPDGNHTVARQLLKGILPAALTGENTMEGVFNGELRPEELDRSESRVRLRLSCMATRIQQRGDLVEVEYARAGGGEGRRVRARHVIMTGWGSVAKHVVPDLAEDQRRALEEYRYSSALYINVLLKHWRPIAEIGAFEMYWPSGYCTWMHVSDPLTVGEYRPEYHPDKPTILSMYKYIHRRGLPPSEQMKLGRYEMETKSFADYEREIRAELNHVLGGHGFDAARDIAGITVNRWGHGYNYFKEPGPREKLENPPYQTGRQKLGRISFAGADAGGTPWTQAALAQAWRAVHEQL